MDGGRGGEVRSFFSARSNMCNALEVILSLGNGSVNVMQLFPADAFFLRTNRTIFFYAFVKPDLIPFDLKRFVRKCNLE